jgi:hypothetical protein
MGNIDWISLVQYKDKRRALVNAVMNLWLPKLLRSSRVAAELAASRVAVSCI